MGYHAAHTPTLIASLQQEPGREFTAAELKARTRIPRKYVRRALTVDGEREATRALDAECVGRLEPTRDPTRP